MNAANGTELAAPAISRLLAALVERCESARNAGGIALCDVLDGAVVPEGWVLDWMTDYYLPPNVSLWSRDDIR